ncbi:MAG: hypothetical protein CVU17_07665 [Betaproteobacteria bacterium HGW-Betaproteobacteria-11]|nr:MAG: hypothetical protein CVU17_07665 [Betaproteobacteria bacterium HGW-Betaproteobacteria-11]
MWPPVKIQRGFVLIGLLALLVMGALAFFVSNLSPEFMQAYRQHKTDAALLQAREALLGYALRFREANPDAANVPIYMYGNLPLPDLGSSHNNNVGCASEGCDAANFAGNAPNITVIGRFPWRMLGTGALRNGNGECLWYIVSGSHQRIQQSTPMNWDTLGQLDPVVANGTAAMQSLLASAHDRPLAIIFSPGPPLPGQDRSTSVADTVTECGGNYDAKNYLDPATATALGGTTNYFAGAANNAFADTSAAAKAISVQGDVLRQTDGTLRAGNCPQDSQCDLVANDKGLILTSDIFFAALTKNANFRLDINSLLDHMVSCLRDQGVASAAHPLPASACYGDSQDPRNYFSNYADQLFVAPCAGNCSATIDGVAQTCPAVLIFANQRDKTSQVRITATDRAAPVNYLEAPNLASFTNPGTVYAGVNQFSPVTTAASVYQDVVRCIPAGSSFTSVKSTTLTSLGFGQLSSYDAATRTLTLGSLNVTTGVPAIGAGNASILFGCSWTPETHVTGHGLRGYFMFNITNTGFPGPGFTFAAIDGDRNTASVCGAASQHLGYSGNNTSTPLVAAPKIGIEFDTRKNYRSQPPFLPDGFNPSLASSLTRLRTLDNGRTDPSYTGGHIAVVYWGGETPINTGYACVTTADCRAPSFCDTSDSLCKLLPEEDDNVHGQLPTPPAARPAPGNPPAPATVANPPPYPPPGVSKLDPNLSSTPTGQNIHVRVEIERSDAAGRDSNSRLVKVAASTPLAALSGLPVVDSVALQAGDTVLVTAQADARTNGVYLASASAWTRDASADEAADLLPGTSWFVQSGSTQAGSLWRLLNIAQPVIGFDSLSFQRVRLPVRAVAISNLAPAGLGNVDGVALAAGDRVLLTAQTTAGQNGVYSAGGGAWSRASPENTAAGLKDGATWFIREGGHAGSYWVLHGDATPDVSTTISIQPAATNDLYAATVQTQVWMLADSVTAANQIERMKTTSRAMAELDPVVRYGQCSPSTCAAGQSCGGVESDGNRYCYNSGQQPNLYDRQKVYDTQGSACSSGLACSGGQFCGIDNLCYQPALRTLRLGFTDSQSGQDQVISISNFATTWLP